MIPREWFGQHVYIVFLTSGAPWAEDFALESASRHGVIVRPLAIPTQIVFIPWSAIAKIGLDAKQLDTAASVLDTTTAQ